MARPARGRLVSTLRARLSSGLGKRGCDLLADGTGTQAAAMAAQDSASHKAFGDLTVDLLKRLDMKVDFAAVDWSTVVARWAQKSPPRQGGWQMIAVTPNGVECANPTSRYFRANGNEQSNGWANNAQIEAEIAAWYNATTLEEEKPIARRLNRLAIDDVLYAPLGVLLANSAWRKSVSRIMQAPLPLFWGVSKTAGSLSRPALQVR